MRCARPLRRRWRRAPRRSCCPSNPPTDVADPSDVRGGGRGSVSADDVGPGERDQPDRALLDEVVFAEELARALGPLYRVCVTDGDGRTLAAFGKVPGSLRSEARLALPNSNLGLLI